MVEDPSLEVAVVETVRIRLLMEKHGCSLLGVVLVEALEGAHIRV